MSITVMGYVVYSCKCIVNICIISATLHMYSEGKFNVQWNLSIVDTTGTQLAVLYTVEPLYSGHHWDPAGCPVYSRTSL